MYINKQGNIILNAHKMYVKHGIIIVNVQKTR